MSITNIEHERANHALEQVKNQPKIEDKHLSSVNGAPALIQNVGLAQALGFWLTKKDDHKFLTEALASYLLENKKANGKDLLNKILKLEVGEYRHYTDKTMSYLIWLKRFTKAFKTED